MSTDIPPCPTVYINNLNEKVKKEELKKALYAIFSQFGPILEIVALRTVKMRGQAFVVFDDTAAATAAIQNMHGFPFYDKPMRLSFAKSKSYATQKKEGTYVAKEYTPVDRKKRSAENKENAMKKKAKSDADDVEMGNAEDGAKKAGSSRPKIPQEPPNKILFVQNLPHDADQKALTELFGSYAGFQEVRLIPAKPGIAFIDYDNDVNSGVALAGLQGFKLTPTNPIVVSFAKQ